MQNINLTPETIKAIAKRINDTKAEGSVTTVEDAEFKQDGFLIMVDYEVYAEWKEMQMTHNEFSFNNVEDLSSWVACDVQLKSICAFDEDGDQLEVTEEDFNAVHQALAVA